MATPTPTPIVLAITGASGAVYAARLLQVLLRAGRDVHLTLSPSGAVVIEQELGIQVGVDGLRPDELAEELDRYIKDQLAKLPASARQHASSPSSESTGRLVCHAHQDFMSPIASGSFLTAGMVICPCSGGTLSAVVHGSSLNLIHRAADVHLKEGRKLILVPRETPLSLLHLDNLRRAAELGAVVLPAMPGWYQGVGSIWDLVDFVVARILDQLGIEHSLMRRWGE